MVKNHRNKKQYSATSGGSTSVQTNHTETRTKNDRNTVAASIAINSALPTSPTRRAERLTSTMKNANDTKDNRKSPYYHPLKNNHTSSSSSSLSTQRKKSGRQEQKSKLYDTNKNAKHKKRNHPKGRTTNHQKNKDNNTQKSTNASFRTKTTATNNEQQQKQLSIESDGMKARISKDAINGLPLLYWKGRIRVLNTVSEMKDGVMEILKSKETHLGFDTETKPAYRKGEKYHPALIQLATNDCVYLFRICQAKESSLEVLQPILQSKHIIKTGVGIHQDVKELQTMMKSMSKKKKNPTTSADGSSSSSFSFHGFVDIKTLTQDVLHYKDTGLRPLAAIFMKGRVSKNAQMTNWACPQNLSPKQIQYAATDAWVSREIYVRAKQEQQQQMRHG